MISINLVAKELLFIFNNTLNYLDKVILRITSDIHGSERN